MIPGYSRIVCTSPSLRQVRAFGRRRLKDKSSSLGFPTFFFFLIRKLHFNLVVRGFRNVPVLHVEVFISQEEF